MLYGKWVVYLTIKNDGEEWIEEEYDEAISEALRKQREMLENLPNVLEIEFKDWDVG